MLVLCQEQHPVGEIKHFGISIASVMLFKLYEMVCTNFANNEAMNSCRYSCTLDSTVAI